MVTIKFLTGWNAHLISKSQKIELDDFQVKSNDFPKIVEKIVRYFDTKDYFYGLFQAMNYSGVSPFSATHDYCLKVLHCDRNGTLEMNISPIYHLGLEYPESYKTKHGKDLDQDAVIGLLTKPSAGTLPPEHTSYSYGVDAGVLFKDSSISHNKKMTLKIEQIVQGLLVTLTCEKQTSSTTMSWLEVGLQKPSKLKIVRLSDEKILGEDNNDWATS